MGQFVQEYKQGLKHQVRCESQNRRPRRDQRDIECYNYHQKGTTLPIVLMLAPFSGYLGKGKTARSILQHFFWLKLY